MTDFPAADPAALRAWSEIRAVLDRHGFALDTPGSAAGIALLPGIEADYDLGPHLRGGLSVTSLRCRRRPAVTAAEREAVVAAFRREGGAPTPAVVDGWCRRFPRLAGAIEEAAMAWAEEAMMTSLRRTGV